MTTRRATSGGAPPGGDKLAVTGRAKKPAKRAQSPASNAEALAVWLEEPGMVALVQLASTLAVAVDMEPDSAPLAREYRMALQELRAMHDAEGSSDGESAFLRAVQATVGDAKKAG